MELDSKKKPNKQKNPHVTGKATGRSPATIERCEVHAWRAGNPITSRCPPSFNKHDVKFRLATRGEKFDLCRPRPDTVFVLFEGFVGFFFLFSCVCVSVARWLVGRASCRRAQSATKRIRFSVKFPPAERVQTRQQPSCP